MLAMFCGPRGFVLRDLDLEVDVKSAVMVYSIFTVCVLKWM